MCDIFMGCLLIFLKNIWASSYIPKVPWSGDRVWKLNAGTHSV